MFSRCFIILIILIWNLFDLVSSLLKDNLQDIHNLSSDAKLLLCSRALLIHLEIQFCIPACCLSFSPRLWYYAVTAWMWFIILWNCYVVHPILSSGSWLFLILTQVQWFALGLYVLQTHCPFANIILILFLSTTGFATTVSLLHCEGHSISADNPVTAETAGIALSPGGIPWSPINNCFLIWWRTMSSYFWVQFSRQFFSLYNSTLV